MIDYKMSCRDYNRLRVYLLTLDVGTFEQRSVCLRLDSQLRAFAAHAKHAIIVDKVDDADLVLVYAPSYLFFGTEDRGRRALRRFRSEPLGHRMIAINLDDRPFPWLRTLSPSVSRPYDNPGSMRSIPYFHYLVDGFSYVEDEDEYDPDLLFLFRGDPTTHPVRRAIVALGENTEWEITQTPSVWPKSDKERLAFQLNYHRSMVRGSFVLCPRGRSPASVRLFEVMRAGRAPVVISDDWVPPAGVNWEKVAVFVREADVPSLPEILRERAHEAEEIGRAARAAWVSWFSEYRIFDYLIGEAWELLHAGSLPTNQRLAEAAIRRLIAGELTKADVWHYWLRPSMPKRWFSQGNYL